MSASAGKTARDDLQSAYAGRACLVTGGAGFLGSNLAIGLVELGARVTVVDALLPEMGGNLWNLAPIRDRIQLALVDLRDRAHLDPLVRGQDYVFNLAGQVSHIDSMRDPRADLAINCDSHLSLLEAVRAHSPAARVIYSATRQQYGRPRCLPVDESHPLVPTDVNGVSKMGGEAYHLLYHRLHGLPATSLRLTNCYGPRQLIRHARQGFLAVFIRRALEGEPIQVFGDGSQQRDLNHVDDVVRAMLLVAAAPHTIGEVYNLGSSEVLTLAEIASMMVNLAGRGRVEMVPFPADRKSIDIGSCHCSHAKITHAVGWRPQVMALDGFRRTLDYYREHMAHYL